MYNENYYSFYAFLAFSESLYLEQAFDLIGVTIKVHRIAQTIRHRTLSSENIYTLFIDWLFHGSSNETKTG